jgi:hypothetical protein
VVRILNKKKIFFFLSFQLFIRLKYLESKLFLKLFFYFFLYKNKYIVIVNFIIELKINKNNIIYYLFIYWYLYK